MLTDEAEKIKVLVSWSREIQLFVEARGPFKCQCGCDYQVTAGRADRVRCPKCKTLLMIEL